MKEKDVVLKIAVIRSGKQTKELVLTKKHLAKGGMILAGVAVGGVIGAKISESILFGQKCVEGFLYL